MSEAVKTKTLRARVMGQPTGTALTLDDQLRGQTLSSVLARLAGPEAALLGQRSNYVVSSGADSRLVDPRHTTLADIAAMFEADQIDVDLNVNARGGGGDPAPSPPPAGHDPAPDATDESGAALAPVRFTPHATRRLRAYSRAVDTTVGDLEVAFLLLGPRDQGRLVSEVFLIRGQEVDYASFFVDGERMRDSVTQALADYPELVVKGIAHRHPGSTAASACHSRVDEEYIEGELLPTLALLGMTASDYSRQIDGEVIAGQIELRLDAEGRQRLRFPAAGGAPPVATLTVSERHAEVVSVVFTQNLRHFYGCALALELAPVASRDGEVRLHPVAERLEPPIAASLHGDDDDAEEVLDREALEREVREQVQNRTASYSWSSARYGRSGTTLATYGGWSSLTSRSRSARDLLEDALADLEDARRELDGRGSPGAPSSSLTHLLEAAVDAARGAIAALRSDLH